MSTIELSQSTADPYVNGAIARDLRRAPAGSTIVLPEGNFLLAGDVDPGIPQRNLGVIGAGPDKTFLTQDTFPNKGFFCGFELQDGLVYENLSLRSPQKPGLQNITVGWSRVPEYGFPMPIGQTARLVNVDVYGHVCAVYSWAGYRNHLIMDHCRVYGARWLVAQAGSNSANDAWYDLFDCELIGDYAKYGPGAGHSKIGAMAGLLARGGQIRMYGGSITLTGDPSLELVVAAWGTNVDAEPRVWPHVLIELFSVKRNIDGKGAKVTRDLWAKIGTVVER